jgi:BirA family biotin operon repressor/biotin-[acetyl-CoA-carboxylase] ligase
VSDSLDPEHLLPLLRGRLGRPYTYRSACASTQHLLPAGVPEGALAACDEQTAGRGRLGRTWTAPAGTAILCSIALRPPAHAAVAQLSLVTALAVAKTVEEAIGQAAGVKWPNDVVVDGRKVAGILLEGRGGAVVAGVGLNVNQREEDLPQRARVPAGSLLAHDGVRRDRAPLLAALLVQLERAYDAWRLTGLATLHPELAARDALLGAEIEVDGLHGVACGLATGGELVVETAAGTRLARSGEVVPLGTP